MEGEDGMAVTGRATIDTRAPFRSVREAVLLFGETVLAGEIYAKQLKEMKTKAGDVQEERTPSKPWTPTRGSGTASQDELEEARRSLTQAREESEQMAKCLRSLKDELDQTRKELQQMRLVISNNNDNNKKLTANYNREVVMSPPPAATPPFNPEIEEIKFVENGGAAAGFGRDDHQNHAAKVHTDDRGPFIENKKIVRFASPPHLTRELMYNNAGRGIQQQKPAATAAPSFREDQGKKKKKNKNKKEEGKRSVIDGWLFPKMKKKNMVAA